MKIKAVTICSICSGPLHPFNGKPIFEYIYLPKLVSTEKFWSTICTNSELQKSGLTINFGFLKYIIHRPHVFFFITEFLALSREQSFSCIHKNNCWYHDCATEHRLIGLFLKINTLTGSVELNINMRSNVFNSLQPLVTT